MGDYSADGSWRPDVPTPHRMSHETSLYWFVNMLVTKRRQDPTCPPWRFAQRIAQSRHTKAFPTAVSTANLRRWTAEGHIARHGSDKASAPLTWWLVGGQTSAEQAVICGGYPPGDSRTQELFEAEAHSRPDLDRDSKAVLELLGQP